MISSVLKRFSFGIFLSLALFSTPSFANNTSILVLGDSLSAAYKMDPAKGWVQLIQNHLTSCGSDYKVINLSTSGDTTRGGLQELPSALKQHNPDIVMIELGGNDGLRGYPLIRIRKNLTKLIEMTKESGAQILLAGIKLPPNYGQDYSNSFHQIYVDLANDYDLAFIEFLLDGVALNTNLMLPDGIHPTAEAQPIIAKHVWQYLSPLLKSENIQSCSFD